MKNAVAILGSPRTSGNAKKMLYTAATCAERHGYVVQKMNLYEKDIAWCKGCMACRRTGICVLEDDIAPIRECIINSDLVILSAPTYFANVPAPVKNMFDRLAGAIMDNHNQSPKPKLSSKQKYLLLTTCSTPFPFDRLANQSSGCIRNMKAFFHMSGMKPLGTVIYSGTRGKTQLPLNIIQKISNCFR